MCRDGTLSEPRLRSPSLAAASLSWPPRQTGSLQDRVRAGRDYYTPQIFVVKLLVESFELVPPAVAATQWTAHSGLGKIF